MMDSKVARHLIGAIAVILFGLVSLSARQAQPAQTAASSGPVTFTKDVAPILQEKCQVCHQPNSIGPMPLITYEDAKKYATSIKSRVQSGLMPPWHIDKTICIRDYKNDRSLSDEQVAKVVRWVD